MTISSHLHRSCPGPAAITSPLTMAVTSSLVSCFGPQSVLCLGPEDPVRTQIRSGPPLPGSLHSSHLTQGQAQILRTTSMALPGVPLVASPTSSTSRLLPSHRDSVIPDTLQPLGLCTCSSSASDRTSLKTPLKSHLPRAAIRPPCLKQQPGSL